MLAIVIPYFKLAFFRETLDSLASQTNKEFKVYIGDDGSIESPIELLAEFKDKFDFFYYKFDQNLGEISLVKQWQRCISLTNDEQWIMILGDDDVIGNNVVKAFYQNLEEIESEEINVIRFATQIIDEIENTVSKVYENIQFENAADFFYKRYLNLVRSSLSEHIFRKEKYLKYSFQEYPLAWHTDDYAWIQFAERKPIFAINEDIIMIRVSDKSLSGINTNLKEKNIADAMFYMDLVKCNLNLFKKDARFQLLMKVEKSIRANRELSLNEWYILLLKYVCNFKLITFSKFIRRFMKSF